MINVIAKHKLRKLRSSKLLLIILIVVGFISLLTMLPTLLALGISAGEVSGSAALASYFQAINFVGHVAALVIGAVCWRQDLRDGTILTFAARPLSRLSLFFGKVLGSIYATLLYFAAALLLFALFDLAFFSYLPPAAFYLYLLQQILSILLTFAVVLFLTSFVNPVMAVVLALLYFFVGTIGKMLVMLTSGFWHGVGIAIRAISIDRALSYSPMALLSGDLGSLAPFYKAIGYYAVWMVLLLSASALLFNRRELLTKRS